MRQLWHPKEQELEWKHDMYSLLEENTGQPLPFEVRRRRVEGAATYLADQRESE